MAAQKSSRFISGFGVQVLAAMIVGLALGLVARKLGDTAMTIVAAPSYAARHGLPRTIEDLEQHDTVGLGYTRAMAGWPFTSEGGTIFMPVAGRVQANDGEALRQLVLGGCGIARLANFTIRPTNRGSNRPD